MTVAEPFLAASTITGPFNVDVARGTRRAAGGFSSCQPARPGERRSRAREILTTLARGRIGGR